MEKRTPLGKLDSFWSTPKCPVKFYDVAVGKELDLGETEHKGNIDAHSKYNILEVEKTVSL